ncbi:hypothetical protein Y032_0066g3773 [Ancylostoma ceylanicum]|uniref:SCP domain-containing protein n=1 Tax=Ancylostoma ceylanicum TaxID=53326 RepID=A0A016U0S2_9BILA|nr:hypothetical protein Y032_0066g3773 [Ancylostoma ceylanicum]
MAIKGSLINELHSPLTANDGDINSGYIRFNCKGISKDKDRKEVLTILNEYRYNLTTENPTYVHAYTNQTYHLPRAKNMYELEWDCDMEAKAEISMNMSCKHAARKAFPEYGHTLGTWEQCIKFGKPVEQYGIRGVLDGWWDQGYGMSDKTKYDDFRIQDFAHIANGRNTKVGCAITKRGQRADVYCLYDLKIKEASLIYEKGDACKVDADCTTYAGSKCLESGLCKGVPPPHYKEKTQALEKNCTDGPTGMNEEIRKYFTDTHNAFRSSVARGLEPDMLGDFTPKAKEMIKLGYDCYVEKVALELLTCPPVHEDQRIFFWNMHNVSNPKMSNMEAAQEAMNSWMNQIRHNGLGPTNVFTEFEYWRAENPFYGLYVPIEDYVNIVVDKNDRLGCVIQDCNGSKYVHCLLGFRYKEPIGHSIYQMGTPCTKNTDCPAETPCLADEGLCSAAYE